MTTDKARKRAVRTRMTKTGESYTAARRQVAGDARSATHGEPEAIAEARQGPEPAPQVESVPNIESARNIEPPSGLPLRAAEPEVSDAAILRATGRTWDEWLGILDERGLDGFSHRETAAWLVSQHGVPGWWAQTVTVGFERARGLRALHQTLDGFSVAVSKTLDVPVDALYRAIVDDAERDHWLPTGTLRLRTATAHRTARFDFRDGTSRVAVGFMAKGPDRSAIAVQQERLAGPEDVEAMRAFWRTALAKLAASLGRP